MVHRGRGCPRLTGPGAGRVIHDPMNGADLARYAPRPRDEALARAWGLSDRFVVGYVGAHGMAHGLANALEAADRLREVPEIVFWRSIQGPGGMPVVGPDRELRQRHGRRCRQDGSCSGHRHRAC